MEEFLAQNKLTRSDAEGVDREELRQKLAQVKAVNPIPILIPFRLKNLTLSRSRTCKTWMLTIKHTWPLTCTRHASKSQAKEMICQFWLMKRVCSTVTAWRSTVCGSHPSPKTLNHQLTPIMFKSSRRRAFQTTRSRPKLYQMSASSTCELCKGSHFTI